MRKPIFPIEQPSILKKTLHQQWEMDASVSNVNESQHPTNNSLTMLDKNPVSYNLTPNDTASLHVCGSPLCSMDMTSGLQDEEHLFRPTLTRRKLVQYDPYSSIVEFQEKDLSVRPQLTSTILYSNSTPKIGQQDVKNKQICSLARQSRRRNMSYYEANYWECVIPKTLRKSTNGQNAALDPNREYQDLLDYTYPLRAEHIDNEWDSIGDSCQQQGLNTQDSGIELDSLCTIIPNGLDSNLGNRIESKALNDVDPKSNSTDRIASLLFFKTKSNDLLLDYVDFIDNDVVSCPHDIQSHHQSEQLSSVSLISRTSLISQSQYVDIDKEFWALPDHLEEGQLLTRQVTEVTTRLNCPVTAFCERMSSILPTISHNEKVIDADANQEGQKYNGNTTTNKKSAVKSGLIDGSLKEVEILMEQLDGLHLSNNQKLNLEDYHQNYSLTQHTHMFCSGLKQYISWLYTFSEKMNILARPTAENDNIRSSLAEYEKFQQEVRSQQYLTSHVLDTGDLLLKCINSTSPLLARTLQLIERQSKAMEKLTDHFFTSI
ncbi:centrosomal protein of 68 kDa isoform X2 [Stigmatopora argus]